MPHLDDFPMSDEEFEQLKDSSALGGVLQIPQAGGGSAEGPDRRRSLLGDHDLGHKLGISLSPEEILSALQQDYADSEEKSVFQRDTYLSSPSVVPLQR
jgi:hypothetical protein